MIYSAKAQNQGRRGSTPVSTVLRKSVRFFIINLFFFLNSKLKSRDGRNPLIYEPSSEESETGQYPTSFPGSLSYPYPGKEVGQLILSEWLRNPEKAGDFSELNPKHILGEHEWVTKPGNVFDFFTVIKCLVVPGRLLGLIFAGYERVGSQSPYSIWV